MRPSINYDFSEFESIMFKLKTDKFSDSVLRDLKDELNSFFKDSKCREAIFTENTDKLFFGMSVVPAIDGDSVINILQSNEKIRFDEYYIELDSKLFSEKLGYTRRELVAVLLHEVGHLVNDTKPVEDVRKAVDVYMETNKDTLVISDSIHYREILAFGIKDSIRKFTSLFEYKDDEIIADEFVAAYGYGKDLESAFKKLARSSYLINRNVDDKLSALSWTLRLYKDLKLKRIPAIKTLNKGKQLTPSRLEKREFENVIRRLNRIDDDALMEAAAVNLKKKYNDVYKKMKYKDIRGYEDDLYEFTMRMRNIEDENDALFLLREINSRMSIIDDYLSHNKLDEKERQRWFNLIEDFQKLREELAKKTIYKNKYSAIVVNYPDIKTQY